MIEPIEQLYFAGLLAPVRLIGERKGTLSVLIDSESAEWEEKRRRDYHAAVNRISQGLDDPWQRRLLLGRPNRLEINPTGPSALYRRARRRTCRGVNPSRSAARPGFRSPSTTAWIHFNLSRSRIANVTLVFCPMASLQIPEKDPETSA